MLSNPGQGGERRAGGKGMKEEGKKKNHGAGKGEKKKDRKR